ncbi:MAG: septal ring lytic transglycosylase RlpA family protein [Ghiorsea sp.]
MPSTMRQIFTLLLSSVLLLSLLSACAPTRYPPGKHQQQAKKAPASSTTGTIKRGKPYQIAGTWYYPLASGEFYDETGMASWYGEDFHGKKTANGETYDMYEMTAAHTTLPLPSTVLVTNLENGKQVKVRVNDRGPFVKSRLIDLSYSAAKALGYAEKGTTKVRVQTLDTPTFAPSTHAPARVVTPATSARAYVQVGAFSVKTSADQVASRLSHELGDQFHANVVPAVGIFRVRLGPFASDDEAVSALQAVKQQGYHNAMVIHD